MGSWSGPVTGEDSNEVDEVQEVEVEVVVALADLRAWLVCMAGFRLVGDRHPMGRVGSRGVALPQSMALTDSQCEHRAQS